MTAPVATIRKNAREEIRLTFEEYKGHRYLDIRIYSDDSGKFKPTRKGIAIRPNLLPQVREALVTAEADALLAGLLKAKA